MKEALNMTDKTSTFKTASATLERTAGYKRGIAQAFNLAEAFRLRGINLVPTDGIPQGQFEK